MTRVRSLDVFRGITIAVMILVNSPGNRHAYSWLTHSDWNGCTLADLVFPFFIVIVGISSALALTHLKQKGVAHKTLLKLILKRSLYIGSMGLLLNLLPNHFDLSHLRLLGVLQRIALCYFFSSLLFLTTSTKTQVWIMSILLLGYGLLMALIPDPRHLIGSLDQFLLTPAHLYTPTFDPEGLLSTIPAIASALSGTILGSILISIPGKSQQVRWIITAGFILSMLGFLLHGIIPFNKSLWSSSYVLWSSGLSFLTFAWCFILIDMNSYTRWSTPFLLLGQNAMLVYMLHVLFLKIQAIILVHNAQGELINLRVYITHLLFGHYSAENASLAYAIGYTLFWILILRTLTKRSSMTPKNNN